MNLTLDVKNPRTGQVDYSITALTGADIKRLSEKSRTSQKAWLAQGLDTRCKALLKLADALEVHSQSVIQALEIDTGRRKMAQAETFGVIANMRAWAALAPTLMPQEEWIQGRAKPTFKHTNAYIPYSLVGVISPWNFPLTLSFIDTIPALLAGACVMIKPSEVTPRFADAMGILHF